MQQNQVGPRMLVRENNRVTVPLESSNIPLVIEEEQ